MRFGLVVCFLIGALGGLAQGKSGTIQVRRPAGMNYFVEIDTPARLKPLPQSGPIPATFLDGILRVDLPCSDCNAPTAMVWMELNVSADGAVESAKVTSSPFPQLNETLKGFAQTQLAFSPTLLQGKKRAVRFAYPVLVITG